MIKPRLQVVELRTPEALANPPGWPELIEAALTVPGSLGNTYNRFYQYSFGNQILLWMQGCQEPVATLKRWNDMGRRVKKGSKAKAIYIPRHVKRVEDDGTEHSIVAGFLLKRCLFGVSDTEGDELPPVVTPEWDKDRALTALDVTEVPFQSTNGNIAGYSVERTVAINPVTPYPFKTLMHELGHIVLGHTAPDGVEEYQTHRGLMEFEAEATAYLTVNELGVPDEADLAESRAYIQHWLHGSEVPGDREIKRVFSATTKILEAGRLGEGSR